MKRLISLALTASLMLALGPASATTGWTAPDHYIVGSGWRLSPAEVPRVEFRLAASIWPNQAIGKYEYANRGGGRISGKVTCGNVDGSVAVVGGNITGGNTAVGGYFLIFVIDNGAPVFGSVGPDSTSTTSVVQDLPFDPGDLIGSDLPADFPAHCPPAQGETYDNWSATDPNSLAPGFRVVLGNIVVR